MGDILWRKNGIKRKGTTFKEMQDLFVNNITTKYIYEPLGCCSIDSALVDAKSIMDTNNYDAVGVIDHKEVIVGYIHKKQINEIKDIEKASTKDHFNKFDMNIVISSTTPLSELFNILSNKECVYILNGTSIDGIVTIADINKPIVRLYLFSLISLFELHITFWINKYYEKESWKDMLGRRRIEKAQFCFDQRRGDNSELTLLECLQICDKKNILNKTNDFLKIFEFDKNVFDSFLSKVELVRNKLSHNQKSIISNLSFNDFVHTINEIKKFLMSSESIIDKENIKTEKN